ncbi:MAG: hypothetical protein LBI03_07575, partial [Clostridiales bacterium]|nr:hypothetical protein [Clostridiales bacterium]
MKLKNRGIKGSISVFICICLTAIISLNFLLFDGARMYAVQSELQNRTDNISYSILGGYDSLLCRDYGLYGLYIQPE